MAIAALMLGAASASGARRRGVPAIPAIAVARGATARRLARDLRRGDARARTRSVAARPRLAGTRRHGAAAGRVRADAGRLRARDHDRAARRAGQEAAASSTARRSTRIEQQFGVQPSVVLAIWGRETAYRRLQAAARRDPRAGDAGLYRPAQGHVPRRVPGGAEDAAGRHAARRRCAAPGAARWG